MVYNQRMNHQFDVFKQHVYDAFTRLQLPQRTHNEFCRQFDYHEWNPFMNSTEINKIIHKITLNYDNLLQRTLMRCTILSTLLQLSTNPHILLSYLNFEQARREALDLKIHLKQQIQKCTLCY